MFVVSNFVFEDGTEVLIALVGHGELLVFALKRRLNKFASYIIEQYKLPFCIIKIKV